MKRFIFVALGLLVLAGCGSTPDPKIQFMGISPGGMQTTLEELKFGDRFPVSEKEFVAVISLENAVDGTSVEATWFSPDDRTMPLGRTAIITESGATIARFTLATTDTWKPAPYKVMVDVKEPKNFITTATGSLQFFIGMTDKQIEAYQAEWTEFDRRNQEELHALKTEGEFEQGLANKAAATFGGTAVLALKKNLLGDEDPEYVFIDTRNQDAYIPSESATASMEAMVRQLVVVDADGGEYFSIKEKGKSKEVRSGDKVLTSVSTPDGVHVSLLPTGTWVLQWEASGKSCVQEIRKADAAYEAADAVCS